MAVKAGFRASLTLNINSGGAVALNTRRGSHTESVENHDTTSTGSTLINNVAQSTIVRGKTVGRLRVSAQYSAGGAGDPPNFAAGNLYLDAPIVYTAGDTISGSYAVEEYTNSHDVDGTIDYDLGMRNNGSITRATGS